MDNNTNQNTSAGPNLAPLPLASVTLRKHVFTRGAVGALNQPNIIQMFVQDKRLDDLMGLISALDADGLANVLSSNEALWILTVAGRDKELLTLIKTLPLDLQGMVLASGNGLEVLFNKGHVSELFALIQKLLPEHQTACLAKEHIIPRYLAHTNELAGSTYDIIAKLSGEQQTQIFVRNNVISALAKHGLALDVFGLIAHLDERQKARVRIAKGYDEVKSFCSRRSTERQPSLRGTKPDSIQLVSVAPPEVLALKINAEERQKA